MNLLKAQRNCYIPYKLLQIRATIYLQNICKNSQDFSQENLTKTLMFSLLTMTNFSENTALAMSIITTDATTIYIEGEPTVHIEHFFDIEIVGSSGLGMIKKGGLN